MSAYYAQFLMGKNLRKIKKFLMISKYINSLKPRVEPRSILWRWQISFYIRNWKRDWKVVAKWALKNVKKLMAKFDKMSSTFFIIWKKLFLGNLKIIWVKKLSFMGLKFRVFAPFNFFQNSLALQFFSFLIKLYILCNFLINEW